MSRPTHVYINPQALVHNVKRIQHYAKNKKIIAMVKANAYGHGLAKVLSTIEPYVDGFGVACAEEALAVREHSHECECILFQGIFNPEELDLVVKYRLQCVIHQPCQLTWILAKPQNKKIKVWIKVNTGMHRLGFEPSEVESILHALSNCSWIDKEIRLITHLACADEPESEQNELQITRFNLLISELAMKRERMLIKYDRIVSSIANSAAIMALPQTHADIVRPGIMLYGISPFADRTARELDLEPVMSFVSCITAIHHYPAHAPIGYGATWKSEQATKIGIIPVGYGDGYPRHISEGTPVWVQGSMVPIVGRISMDMLTVNLTNAPHIQLGDAVEMWGKHIPVEVIAKSAGTIAYELICQVSSRVRK